MVPADFAEVTIHVALAHRLPVLAQSIFVKGYVVLSYSGWEIDRKSV